MIIHPQYDDAGHFHEGIAPVLVKGQWGFIDTSGVQVVPPQFQAVMAGTDGRFGVEKGGVWGFMKSNAEMLISPRFDDVKPFSDGVAAFRIGDKWGYVDATGSTETTQRYDYAGRRYEGRQFITIPDEGFVLGTSLGQALDNYFGAALSNRKPSDFSEGIAVISFEDGRFRLIDLDGSSPDKDFAAIGTYSEGCAPATSDGKRWGYINKSGEWIVKPAFEKARSFSEGLAPVQVGGKWGYIDQKGKLIAQPKYDAAYPFQDGMALIRIEKKRGFVSHVGSLVTEAVNPQFEDAYAFKEGFAPVKVNGKWGFLAKGQEAESTVRDVVDISGPSE